MVDVKCLSDYELRNELDRLGFSPGPMLSSTRKLYENKLMQLLVSPPYASPVKNGPGKQDRVQGYDDSKELNAIIILKGNVILSSEKNKGPKNRPKASTTKPKAQDTYCLGHKHSEKIRWAARATGWSNTEENWSAGSRNLERFPVGLKLAVFVIFVFVLFVYITVEKKTFFG